MTEQNRTGAMVAEAPDELEQEPTAQVQHADYDGTTNGAETSPVAVVAEQSAAHEPAAAVHDADGQPAPADEPITGSAAASASAIVDATSAPETAQDAQDGAVGHTLTFHAETEAEASQPAEQNSDSTAVADATDAVAETAETVADATDAVAETVADATDAVAETVADATDAVAETVADATEQASAAVADATDAVAETVADATDAVAETVADATDAVAETVADATEQASAAVADATDAVAETVADATDAAPATEPVAGASFTPVEEETDRPRRLKDLTVGMELAGKITSIALYGVFVDVGVGRDGLLHISEMSEGRVASPSELVEIGQAVQVRVKSIDLEARRISLTMRTERAPEERRRGKPRTEVNREALAELKVGDTIEGTITGLSKFGAFVDIGVGKDGLVHVSELSESRVEKPEDVVQVGQKYLFKLLEIDPDGSRISLSLRKAQRAQKMRELEPGQTFDGVVSGVAPFGAFIDIGVGRDGLVHISQIAEERVSKVADKLKVGDKVSVRVLEVDPQSKRISLTMRPERTPEELAEIESRLNPPSDPAPAPNRFTLSQEQREEARQREQQSRRRTQQRNQRTGDTPPAQNQTDVVYATPDDPEENFEGNATLDDLLSKFGGANRRDRRRTEVDEDGDEDEAGNEQRQRQRQREAIRRTLKQDDEG